MSAMAIEITQDDGEIYRGLLISDPQVGQDCRVNLGRGHREYRIVKVKGWIKLVGAKNAILFDHLGKRFHVEVLSTSEEFL
jgi:hypothetical protein